MVGMDPASSGGGHSSPPACLRVPGASSGRPLPNLLGLRREKERPRGAERVPALSTAGSGTLTPGQLFPSPPASGCGDGAESRARCQPPAAPRPAALPPRPGRSPGGSWRDGGRRGFLVGAGGAGAALRGGKRVGGPRCPPGWWAAPGGRSRSANGPGPAAPLPLPPPGRTRRRGGGGSGRGGCASHRLLWPFCFAGGFRCRDVRDVTWGFLPPRWS